MTQTKCEQASIHLAEVLRLSLIEGKSIRAISAESRMSFALR